MNIDDLIREKDETLTLVQNFGEITLSDGTKVDVVMSVTGMSFELWPEDERQRLVINLKPLFKRAAAMLEEMGK